MNFRLMEVRGLVTALLTLKMSKRTYTEEYEEKLRLWNRMFTHAESGFVISPNQVPARQRGDYEDFIKALDTLAKWGAGVGLSSYMDAGHETLLRFIDLMCM